MSNEPLFDPNELEAIFSEAANQLRESANKSLLDANVEIIGRPLAPPEPSPPPE